MAPQPRKHRTLFETASKLPIESILHAVPVIGVIFAPFDLARAAKQATQIEDLKGTHTLVLQRDLKEALRSGKLPVRHKYTGPNSVEFSTQQFLTLRARRLQNLGFRVRKTQQRFLATQRVLRRRAA